MVTLIVDPRGDVSDCAVLDYSRLCDYNLLVVQSIQQTVSSWALWCAGYIADGDVRLVVACLTRPIWILVFSRMRDQLFACSHQWTTSQAFRFGTLQALPRFYSQVLAGEVTGDITAEGRSGGKGKGDMETLSFI